MKKFLIEIGLFFAIVFGSIICFICAMPINHELYNYAYVQKMKRLDSTSSPRLVFVGGSNVAFGINSRMLADSLKINVCNTGLHAGIGLRFMLDDVAWRLRSGDIVVIMPEYSHFFNNFCGSNDPLAACMVYSWPRSLLLMNFKQFDVAMTGLPQFIKNNLLSSENGKQAPYSALNFNEFGDEEWHWQFPPQSGGKQLPLQGNFDSAAADYVVNAARHLRDRGVEVILLPPMDIQSNVDNNRPKIDILFAEMSNRGLPFSAPIGEFTVPDTLGYDTPYHMSGIAVQQNAQKLLHRLREILTD